MKRGGSGDGAGGVGGSVPSIRAGAVVKRLPRKQIADLGTQ